MLVFVQSCIYEKLGLMCKFVRHFQECQLWYRLIHGMHTHSTLPQSVATHLEALLRSFTVMILGDFSRTPLGLDHKE